MWRGYLLMGGRGDGYDASILDKYLQFQESDFGCDVIVTVLDE